MHLQHNMTCNIIDKYGTIWYIYIWMNLNSIMNSGRKVDIMNDKKNLLKWLPAITDACIIIVAYLLAYYLRFFNPIFHEEMGYFYPLERYVSLLVYLVPIYLVIYFAFRLYTTKLDEHTWYRVLKLVISNILGLTLFMLLLYLLKEINISRKFLLLFFVINVVLGISSRLLITYSARLKLRRG